MKFKISFNKLVYTIICVLVIFLIFILAFSIRETKKRNGEYESNIYLSEKENEESIYKFKEAVLPNKENLEKANLYGIRQTNKINEGIKLKDFEIEDNKVKYNYITKVVTTGERLSVTAEKMEEDIFNKSIPSVAKSEEVKGKTIWFNERNLYFAKDGSKIPQNIQKASDEGRVVIRYGNNADELLPMKQIMWYEDGTKYTLECIAMDYDYEDMKIVLKDFLNTTI